MGKRNNTRSEDEKGNIGCMWGLIRMLHFRRDPKMILDQREGSRQFFIDRYSKGIKSSGFKEINEDDYDADQPKTKPTVKKLMEKEMTGDKIGKRKIPSDEIDRILADWGHKSEPDKRISKKKRPKSNLSANPNSNSTESNDFEVVLASFLAEIYRYHNECQLCKNKTELCPTLRSIVYSKLNDLSPASKDRNTTSGKHLHTTGITRSREFMNALEILGSNKELFLKMLHDPDSHVLEKVQEISEKRERKKYFRRKEEDGKTDNSPSVSKIVVLKPKATAKPSYDTKAVSNFSLREIKRKLRQIIGESTKERKDPYLFKVVHGMHKPYQQVHATFGSSFYEEAKKHLTEILRNGNEAEKLTSKHVSIPLGKILCLTENNLELNWKQKVEKDENAIESVSLTKEGLESSIRIKEEEQENSINNESVDMELQEGPHNEDEITGEGTGSIIEIKIEDSTENTLNVDVSLEATSDACIILNEASKDGSIQQLSEELEPAEEDAVEEPTSVSPNSMEISIIERPVCQSPGPSTSYSCKESFCEKTDQPSPISVLEPFFSDDVPSPDCRITDPDELHKNPSHTRSNLTLLLEDSSARSEFIKLVLEASGMGKEERLERWCMEEELLEPSLFDQLDISTKQEDDSRLLFDCILEVLVEIRKRYFRFSQYVPVRRKSLLHEVCQGVGWHLRNNHAFLLDHIIRNDLNRSDWCDLREETEDIVAEIWDELIDDLLEETVFDLWL